MSVVKRILSVWLLVCIMLFSFTACGEDYKDAYIYFELLDAPRTLDPQTASSDSELLIVRNIYEGLLRKNSDGEIVNGVISDYTYENLTYSFVLKPTLEWSDGTPVTAYDFVYGFRRAVDPKIKAPFADRLKSIQGAEAIMSGNAGVETLGVVATGKYSLKIVMCREDEGFTDTLTTSVCMPCKEEFFENSIGKYGLDAECIISNGSYRLTKWNKEDFGIRLYKNEGYTGDFESQNAAVFISCIKDEAQHARLSEGESDMAFLPCSELSKTGAGLKTVGVNNICWYMTLSRSYSPEVRRSFATAFSSDIYEASLPSGFSAAKSIYPDILNINTDGIGISAYNLEDAKAVMSTQIAGMQGDKFPQATLYYYNVEGIKNTATSIVGHWQQNLSTFINIKESENLSALQNEIVDSTLDFALFPITARGKSFSEYAVNFATVSTAATPDALQQDLLKNHSIIPVAYQSTNIRYISSLENVVMEESNGYIDFSVIIKR